jgi:predicted RNase H-like HicB family nuclease
LNQPNTKLTIDVDYNTEDAEYGAVYIATNNQIGLVTDGRTFDELLTNLKEALDACLGEIDTVAAYNLISNPEVELRMHFSYAQIT